MHKVLCEHPRGGWRGKRRRRYRGPIEDAPTRESTSRHRGGTKWLGENLGPLRRWLLAQVGRPWNLVHAELRAQIHRDSAVRLHIWEHAEHYVARVVEIDGRLYYGIGRRGSCHRSGTPLRARSTPVYVCPHTGILRRTR